MQAAFPVFGSVGAQHAVEMHDHQGERPIANAAFRWLARCAERAGDAEAQRISEHNAGLGF